MTAGRKVCGAETDLNRRAGAPGSPPPETGGIAERGWNTFQHYSATSGILSEVRAIWSQGLTQRTQLTFLQSDKTSSHKM